MSKELQLGLGCLFLLMAFVTCTSLGVAGYILTTSNDSTATVTPTAKATEAKNESNKEEVKDEEVSTVCNKDYVSALFQLDPTKLQKPAWGCDEGSFTGAWTYANEDEAKTIIVPKGTVVDYFCTRFTEGQQLTVGKGEKASIHFFPTTGAPNSVGVGCGGEVGHGEKPKAKTEAPTQKRESEFGQCFLSPSDIAGVVGGKSANWTAPDWGEGAWGYKGESTELTIPSWGGQLDYWDGSPKSITTGSITVDEASFHCPK